MENLKKINIQELTKDEIENINGGLFGIDDLILALVAGTILAVLDDLDGFADGVSSGFNATANPPIN